MSTRFPKLAALPHSPRPHIINGRRLASKTAVSLATFNPHSASSDFPKHSWNHQQRTPDTPNISSSHIQTVKPPKIKQNVQLETIEPIFPNYFADIASKPIEPMDSEPATSESAARWELTDLRPYKDRSTLELLNSVLVFQTCRIPGLVSIVSPIISAAKSLRAATPVYAVVKRTFFAHFCGGENIDEVKPTMAKFASQNVGTILDLAMEADIDAAQLQGEDARIQASKIKEMMMQSIDIASSQPDSFIAVKVTAFVPPQILQRWSNTLRILKLYFTDADTDHDGLLSQSEFVKMILRFSSVSTSMEGPVLTEIAEKLFKVADKNKDSGLDRVEMTNLFSPGNDESRPLVTEIMSHAVIQQSQVPDSDKMWHDRNDLITLQDRATLDLVLGELDALCLYAKEKGVRIMIDAEQTYFQPAIDDIVLSLCKKFNPPLRSDDLVSPRLNTPVIFNTYQMYLVDAYSRMESDINRAHHGNYSLGIKIVRGAYMSSERKRAKAFGYPDPINPDIESTHAQYNKAIELLVSKIKPYISPTGFASSSLPENTKTVPISFVVASHNLESIHHAREVMSDFTSVQDNEAKSGQPLVAFAQLMGMKDNTSFGLAANGYKAYKYVPYGPIDVTIPYLLRRAQENSALLGGKGAIEDRKVITEEIWRRVFG